MAAPTTTTGISFSSSLSNGEPGAPAPTAKKLRVFFIPFFAASHIIPTTDLACLLAAARPGVVEATMVVTPANAKLIAATLAAAAAAGHTVRVLTYPFPDVGLAPGVENLGAAASADEWRVYRAVELCPPAHTELLREHRPDAVVADVPFWWATDIAAELGIPRLTFHPAGVFPELVMNNLFKIRSRMMQASAPAEVAVPDLPGPEVRLPMRELPDFLVRDDLVSANWDKMRAAERDGFGAVVNTFLHLEGPYCELYARAVAPRAYFVGPLGLRHDAAAHRAGHADVACLDWLDGKPSRSVVYLCFGSWFRFSAAQLREMALGLEASAKPFLWAVRAEADGEGWAPEGWEERVRDRGLVVGGWVPQTAILAHPAVGAFVTHCGWNSMLEAAAAGVPVLTWPLVFEQFINEKLAVQVLGLGEKVWEGGKRSQREEERETVPASAIAAAVAGFLEPGGKGEEARARAEEVAAKARAAVAVGGSSYGDVSRLIDDLVEARAIG